jgi:hypothetical protein
VPPVEQQVPTFPLLSSDVCDACGGRCNTCGCGQGDDVTLPSEPTTVNAVNELPDCFPDGPGDDDGDLWI